MSDYRIRKDAAGNAVTIDNAKRILMCYTRSPTTQEEANNADIALSMHMALRSPADGKWIPLNEDYGILFAAGIPLGNVPAKVRAACRASSRIPVAQYIQKDAPSEAVQYGAVMPGVDIELKSLRDPFIFRRADGGFGIVATRTARGGKEDGSERSSFLLVLSDDLVRFTQLGQVTMNTLDGVHSPRMRYDSRSGCYIANWWDDNGLLHGTRVNDLDIAVQQTLTVADDMGMWLSKESRHEQQRVSSRGNGIRNDWRIGNSIEISRSEASVLVERFGRIYNTGVEIPTVRFADFDRMQGEVVTGLTNELERVQACLHYSDDSVATRKVIWDACDIQTLAHRMKSGGIQANSHAIVRGCVKQTAYPVPFAKERADPSVFAWSWNGKPMYLFIATDDQDGNCVDPRGSKAHMPMRVSSSIIGLSDERMGRAGEIDLLSKGDCNSEKNTMTGCFWAPEFHVIGGRLSILFMPCFNGKAMTPEGSPNDRAGLPDMWTGRCHIMQLLRDGDGCDRDPRDPDNWSDPEPIVGPDGGMLNPIQGISLDMTVIQDDDRWFYAWQQVGSVWIASFDPAHPARLTSNPSQIIVPEFAWDNMIAEGPNAIVHNGRIYLIYSGSLVGVDYTTGLATAPAGIGADLLNPSSWEKLDYPLQKSGVYNEAWQLGTGHGMWSHDEDGNLIYVFHNARFEGEHYHGRDTQIRRVHWSAEGMPILDMQSHEEIDPALRDVYVDVQL